MTDDEREAEVRRRELPWTDCAFLLDRLDAARARAAALEAVARGFVQSIDDCNGCMNGGSCGCRLVGDPALAAARRLLGESPP